MQKRQIVTEAQVQALHHLRRLFIDQLGMLVGDTAVKRGKLAKDPLNILARPSKFPPLWLATSYWHTSWVHLVLSTPESKTPEKLSYRCS